MTDHFLVPNWFDQPTVAFDLDGTLLDDDHQPIVPHAQLAQRLRTMGVTVVVCSARPAANVPAVRRLLRDAGIHVDEVFCGSKPAADVFIDDRSPLPPPEALEEWVLSRLDARRAAGWSSNAGIQSTFSRRMGEHAEGQAHVDGDPNFRLIVPVSAGLDSTTAHDRAVAAGYDVTPVSVITGVPYVDREAAALETLGIRPVRLQPPDGYGVNRHGRIERGRNAAIISAAADWLQRTGGWGELWFGNVAKANETTITTGDKGARFFGTMQAMLYADGIDLRISNPCGAERKVDLVRWHLTSSPHADPVGRLLDTFSCHDYDDPGRCGRCNACMGWTVALLAGGVPADRLHWAFTRPPDFTVAWKELGDQPDDGFLLNRHRMEPYQWVRSVHPELFCE